MDTKIKEVLKFAQVKQRAIESHRKSAPKVQSPQKKQEKSSKGTIAPGVQAYLDQLEKANKEQKPKDFHSSKNSSVGSSSSTSSSSSSMSAKNHEDFDPNCLFKSDRRVARLPDAAIPNMLELSKMRREMKRKKEEERAAAFREKEERERLEREKQREKERAEVAKKEALQRALKSLGSLKPEVSGTSQSQVKPATSSSSSQSQVKPATSSSSQSQVKPTTSSSSSQSQVKRTAPSSSSSSSSHGCPDAKKRKLNDGTSRPSSASKPASFKIPRKSAPAGPPPPSFDDLLKVAEKNASKPVSIEAAREIISVDLFAPSKPPVVPTAPKSSNEFGRLKNGKNSAPISKSSADKPSSESKSSVSISKLASSLDKTKLPPSSACTSATKAPKPIGGAGSQKLASTAPKRNLNKDSAFKKPLPLTSKAASLPSKTPATIAKRPLQNVTSKNSANIRPSGAVSGQQSSGSQQQRGGDQQLNDLLVLERQARSIGNEALRKELLKLISKHKNSNGDSACSPNSTVVKGSSNGNNNNVGQKPGVVQRPNGSSENGPSKSKPVASGWERAMSHLQQKKTENLKKRPAASNVRRIESDEEEEEEYDSEMDDFIDDGDAGIDYRTEIRQMFKYDPRKFRDEDDDVDNMESNFAQIEKEEAFSAKVGRKEDLEDMMMEQEELRRKKEMLMKKKKSS